MKIQKISYKKFSFENLLDLLGVNQGDNIFLHSSFSRLKGLFDFPEQLINELLERLGEDGTLSMPRYVWHRNKYLRPWVGYNEFINDESVLDLRFEQANIGIIPEKFRHIKGVHVGTSYFWPVTAIGTNSDIITSKQEMVVHPYGPGSTFYMILHLNTKILGLGVSLNTSSIAPVSDWFIGDFHRKNVFTSVPLTKHLIDIKGKSHITRSYTLLPETVRNIKPSIVLDNVINDDSILLHHDETIYFCYPSMAYHKVAIQMAFESYKIGKIPPWLPHLQKTQNCLC